MSLAREHGVEKWMELYFAKLDVYAPLEISKVLMVLDKIKRVSDFSAVAMFKIGALVEQLKEAISHLSANSFEVERLLVEAQKIQCAAGSCQQSTINEIRTAIEGRLLLLARDQAIRGISQSARRARRTRALNDRNQQQAKKRRRVYQDEAEKVCMSNPRLNRKDKHSQVATLISERLVLEAMRDHDCAESGRPSDSEFELIRQSEYDETPARVRRKFDGLKLSTNSDTIRKDIHLPIIWLGKK